MKNKVVTALITAALGVVGSTSTAYADWDIIPFINVLETYTDDVNLDSSFAQSDFVTQTTVGADVTTEGPRLNLNMNYGLTHLYYPGLEGDKDEFRHSFLGDTQAELIRETLFFEASAGVTQQFINRQSAFSSVKITRSKNRGTLSIINASPYMLNKVAAILLFWRQGIDIIT